MTSGSGRCLTQIWLGVERWVSQLTGGSSIFPPPIRFVCRSRHCVLHTPAIWHLAVSHSCTPWIVGLLAPNVASWLHGPLISIRLLAAMLAPNLATLMRRSAGHGARSAPMPASLALLLLIRLSHQATVFPSCAQRQGSGGDKGGHRPLRPLGRHLRLGQRQRFGVERSSEPTMTE